MPIPYINCEFCEVDTNYVCLKCRISQRLQKESYVKKISRQVIDEQKLDNGHFYFIIQLP